MDRFNATTPLVISNGGNVGIGTTSPLRSLHVRIGGASSGIGGYSGQTTALFQSTASATTNARISITAGNTGASIIDLGDTDNDLGGIHYLHATDSLKFLANGAYRQTILSNGNVGIGTETPIQKLDIM